MEGPPTSKKEKVLTSEELETFRQEIAPIFDERFFTIGHGTRVEAADQIIENGLRMAVPKIETTAIGLENSEKDIQKLLNWEHLNAKAVVIIMVPKTLPNDADIIKPTNDERDVINQWVLPPAFIRGYVDVEKRKFVMNPRFEENPSFERRAQTIVRPTGIMQSEAPLSEDSIPKPSESGESDVDVF